MTRCCCAVYQTSVVIGQYWDQSQLAKNGMSLRHNYANIIFKSIRNMNWSKMFWNIQNLFNCNIRTLRTREE